MVIRKTYNQTHGGYIGRWRIGRDMLIRICQGKDMLTDLKERNSLTYGYGKLNCRLYAIL